MPVEAVNAVEDGPAADVLDAGAAGSVAFPILAATVKAPFWSHQ